MKKAIAVLFALLAAALFCFFAGWAQFAVPPGSVGVMRSKSHGLAALPVEGGAFTWVWYKLIPSNVTVSAFKLSERTLRFETAGALAQADTYIAFTGIKGDFSFGAEIEAVYAVRPGSLPLLASERDIWRQEELDAYLDTLNEKIRSAASGAISARARAGGPLFANGGEEAARAALEAEFPYLDWTALSIYPRAEPDFALYAAARETYALYVERYGEILRREALRRAEERAAQDFRREELEKYGELITRYPFILEYLKLAGGAEGPEDTR